MTKRNNKKTPEPMFVGTEPEEMANHINPEVMTETLQKFSQVNPEDFFVTSGQMEVNGNTVWISETSEEELPVWIEESGPTLSVAQGVADKYLKEEELQAQGMGSVSWDQESGTATDITELVLAIQETDDGTRPSQPAGEKEYKHPFDPINDLHYQLNNAIQPLVDSMQKIIRDPYKAKESMSEQHFNYMVKEYGYLHSFLELSHKIIKERLRERG